MAMGIKVKETCYYDKSLFSDTFIGLALLLFSVYSNLSSKYSNPQYGTNTSGTFIP